MNVAPFDIPADLDTPVSAFLKLAPLTPRFLLESVEGGERVGRYSILGFGDAEELRIEPGPVTPDPDGFLRQLRRAHADAPRLEPAGLPFTGGLVGAVSFEATRRAELDRLDFKLSALPPDARDEARARVDEITHLLVEKLLLTPTEQLKALGDEGPASYSEALTRLFGLAEQDRPANVEPFTRKSRTPR